MTPSSPTLGKAAVISTRKSTATEIDQKMPPNDRNIHASTSEYTRKSLGDRRASATESTSWSRDDDDDDDAAFVAMPSLIVESKKFPYVSPEPQTTEEVIAQFWNEPGFADQDGSSGTSFTLGSSSFSHFQKQVSRVVGFIVSEKINHEMFAKALLEELIRQPHQQSISAEFFQKVDGLTASYNILEKYAANMTHVLTKMARKADQKLRTPSAVTLLEREMEGANKSSTFIVVLSDIYQFIRTAQEASTKPAIKGGSSDKWVPPSTFERKTSKYWIAPGRMTDLLLAAVEHVPLLVYGESGRLTKDEDLKRSEGDKLWNLSSSISSVYFDSPSMSLYNDRVNRCEGAKLFRIRWYGQKPEGDEVVFLELKTHHECWINEKSVKERVNICEKDVKPFIFRKHLSKADAKQLVRAANPELKDSDVDESVGLLLMIKELIVKHALRPCIRTHYQRVAFQSSENNYLRITIDRDILLIDERSVSSGEWFLKDGAIKESMIVKTPFDVLEVKLNGSDFPESIESLLDDGVIHDATKFSKFLTAAAAFNKVEKLPYWAEHSAFAPLLNSGQTSTLSSGPDSMAPPTLDINNDCISTTTTNVAAGRHKKKDNHDDDRITDRPPWKNAFGSSLRRRKSQTPTVATKPSLVRVEPKTYFANERTLIQWLSASILLVTIALIMMNYDSEFWMVGLVLLGCGAVVALYSMFVYSRRVRLLSSGKPYGYLDHLGPKFLTMTIFVGIVAIFTIFVTVGRPETEPSYTAILPKEGFCVLHDMASVSRLEYQPSDLLTMVDDDEFLMVASLDTLRVQEGSTGRIETIVTVPGADFEGLTSTGRFLYALSETNKKTKSELLEFDWFSEQLIVRRRWEISTPKAEGITFVPGNPGRFYIAGDMVESVGLNVAARGTIDVYELPGEDDVVVPDAAAGEEPSLIGRPLNAHMISEGLTDSKISALQYFEDVLYVLHDNDRLVRAWDLNGILLSEWKLPTGSKQWEGLAFQRRPAPNEKTMSMLRDGGSSADGELLLHLALDSPPEVWTFTVQEGTTRGSIIFPACASV